METKLIRKTASAVLLSMLLNGTMCHAQTEPVTQQGDRYIINVQDMDLNGDETLYDILLTCPDVISLDGKNVIRNEAFARMYGKIAIRIDNVEYGLDQETLLHTLRAYEIDKIKICNNSEVMKGCSGLKKVIDIYLVRREDGANGHVALRGNTYGGVNGFVQAMHQSEKMRLFGIVEGNTLRTKDKDASPAQTNHNAHEGVKLNMAYDITPKDHLEVDYIQAYERTKTCGNAADNTYAMHLEADYTRTLSDAGAYALVTIYGDYVGDKGNGYHSHATYPFGLAEFSFPIINHDLWFTTGIETGLSVENNRIKHYTNRSRYEDLYSQIDWNIGSWSIALGDRFRTIGFTQKDLKDNQKFEHNINANMFIASVTNHLNKTNTLYAAFSRRGFNPDFSDFVIKDIHSGETGGALSGAEIYTDKYNKRFAYVSELKHTYSKPNLIVSTSVNNIRQKLDTGHDNTLGVGSTLFWHKGALRLTAGLNYFWEKTSRSDTDKEYSNFAIFKLAPQLTLPAGWRVTSTLIQSTRRHEESPAYAPANFYADVAVMKKAGKHWLLECRYQDIASQHLGNRSATVGATFIW